MGRAVLHEGVIEPWSSLPEEWQEGQELLIQEVDSAAPEDWDAWEQEMEALAAKIPPEDHLRVEAALAAADHHQLRQTSEYEVV